MKTSKSIFLYTTALMVTVITFSCKKHKDAAPQTLTVSTLAGSGINGDADGSGATAQFTTVIGMTSDAQGNIYVTSGQAIKKITPSGQVSTLAGIYNQNGFVNGAGSQARFSNPSGLAIDAAGNVIVADASNNCIRKITASGVVSTVAGDGNTGNTNGNGIAARFNTPYDVALDASGNIFVADLLNNRIRKIDAGGNVSTYAGSAGGFADGSVSSALFNGPYGLATDKQGNVYVSDRYNKRIRKIAITGTVTTIAGNDNIGLINGPAASATFSPSIMGVKVADNGDIYVADRDNYCIRKISGGEVSTYAGSGISGFADGNPSTAQFKYPWGLALYGNTLYVADALNYRIRKVAFQ